MCETRRRHGNNRQNGFSRIRCTWCTLSDFPVRCWKQSHIWSLQMERCKCFFACTARSPQTHVEMRSNARCELIYLELSTCDHTKMYVNARCNQGQREVQPLVFSHRHTAAQSWPEVGLNAGLSGFRKSVGEGIFWRYLTTQQAVLTTHTGFIYSSKMTMWVGPALGQRKQSRQPLSRLIWNMVWMIPNDFGDL